MYLKVGYSSAPSLYCMQLLVGPLVNFSLPASQACLRSVFHQKGASKLVARPPNLIEVESQCRMDCSVVDQFPQPFAGSDHVRMTPRKPRLGIRWSAQKSPSPFSEEPSGPSWVWQGGFCWNRHPSCDHTLSRQRPRIHVIQELLIGFLHFIGHVSHILVPVSHQTLNGHYLISIGLEVKVKVRIGKQE